MASVRTWFAEHPPTLYVRCLEVSVKLLNWVLLVLGLVISAWAITTVVQIQNEQPVGPPPSPPGPPPLLPAGLQPPAASAASAAAQHRLTGGLHNVPWFIYVFGALGLATTLTAGTALLGIRLRSPGCMSGHVFFMCLLLTGQACAAVAFFMDHAWQKRLPDIDEKLKEFLAARLQVGGRCTASWGVVILEPLNRGLLRPLGNVDADAMQGVDCSAGLHSQQTCAWMGV